MVVHDVSLTLREGIPSWPGDPTFRLERVAALDRGDPANVSRLTLGTHTGTHVDAPAHFLATGGGADTLSLDTLIGPCTVIEADPPAGILRPADLGDVNAERVLFKTSNSGRWALDDQAFDSEFVAVGPALAQALVDRGFRLVGVDYLSVETFHTTTYPVHQMLLSAGVVIVEGLDLSAVEPGEYLLWCLPLKVAGADGSPARALLTS